MSSVITRKVEFDAGHRIPNHASKCRNLHGHRYVLECTVAGPLVDTQGDSSDGMVIDFGILKQIMLDEVAEPWDHALLVWDRDETLLQLVRGLELNECGHKTVVLPCIPTAENLAGYAFTLLNARLLPTGLTLLRVRLYETPNCWADAHTPM
jgi:6-pyruvoyltetrahydropterin/6-carboxytetrahydropterin synthase